MRLLVELAGPLRLHQGPVELTLEVQPDKLEALPVLLESPGLPEVQQTVLVPTTEALVRRLPSRAGLVEPQLPEQEMEGPEAALR